MNIQENKPYTPFALAMVFLALPLFTLLYDILTVWIGRQSGILWAVKHEQVYLLPLWDTGLLAMSVVGFIFNAIIALCLAKVAAQKRMRRVCGVGLCHGFEWCAATGLAKIQRCRLLLLCDNRVDFGDSISAQTAHIGGGTADCVS